MGMMEALYYRANGCDSAGTAYPSFAMSFSTVQRRTPVEVSHILMDCAYKVHTYLGPGLLESACQACLEEELKSQGMDVRTQVPVPVVYRGRKLEAGYRIDLLVEDCVVVEIKSVEALAPVHFAQTLSYLRLSGKSLALLINFNVVHLKDGIKRQVMGTDWK
jgi:GxxExxY protein